MAAFLSVCAVATMSLAGFRELGNRLPTDTNAIVAVNLDRVMASPLAQKDGWKQKWADQYEAGPVSFPPGTKNLLTGARMLPNLHQAKWQISLMDLSSEIPLEDTARAEGGYVDKLWTKMAVVSPAGLYFVQLEPTLLASIQPADRSFSVAWVRQSDTSKGPDSQFIKGVVGSLGASSHIVMALDLQDAWSPSDVRRVMETAPLKCLETEKVDLDTLAHVLASIQNITFESNVDEDITARITMKFGMEAGMMEFYGKPIMVEVLDRAGLAVPDIKDWKATIAGQTCVLEGSLKQRSLREMLSVLFVPGPANPTEPTVAKASDDPAAIGLASQKYYRAINRIIDQYQKQDSYTQVSGWLTRSAQQIDRLPIVNADPELVSWGAEVSSRMRQVAAMLSVDQQTALAKQQGVSTANYSYYVNYQGQDGTYYNNATVANKEYQRQRAQALSEQRAKSTEQAQQIMGTVLADRAKIRARMTEKYKIEF